MQAVAAGGQVGSLKIRPRPPPSFFTMGRGWNQVADDGINGGIYSPALTAAHSSALRSRRRFSAGVMIYVPSWEAHHIKAPQKLPTMNSATMIKTLPI